MSDPDERISICDIIDCCKDCPKMGYDCDGHEECFDCEIEPGLFGEVDPEKCAYRQNLKEK